MTGTVQDLDWIHNRWADLRATRLRGTPKPWKEPTLTTDQLGQLNQQARIEKQERGAFTLGESPAPIHLDALDKELDLTHTMVNLARRIALELGHTAVYVRAVRAHYQDPLHLIHYVRNHFNEVTPDIGEDIDAEATRIRLGLMHHFSELGEGQRLKTDCPYCDQPTLYVRTIGAEGNTQPVIRCESGTCDPDQAHCGARHRNLPIWPQHEWEWLAKEIHYADHQREEQRRKALQIAGINPDTQN